MQRNCFGPLPSGKTTRAIVQAGFREPAHAVGALNNVLRVLHPNSPLSTELKEHVAARLMYHAETEGAISDQILGERKGYGPHRLAAQGMEARPAEQ